jgi:hypothetical protein
MHTPHEAVKQNLLLLLIKITRDAQTLKFINKHLRKQNTNEYWKHTHWCGIGLALG